MYMSASTFDTIIFLLFLTQNRVFVIIAGTSKNELIQKNPYCMSQLLLAKRHKAVHFNICS